MTYSSEWSDETWHHVLYPTLGGTYTLFSIIYAAYLPVHQSLSNLLHCWITCLWQCLYSVFLVTQKRPQNVHLVMLATPRMSQRSLKLLPLSEKVSIKKRHHMPKLLRVKVRIHPLSIKLWKRKWLIFCCISNCKSQIYSAC